VKADDVIGKLTEQMADPDIPAEEFDELARRIHVLQQTQEN
jgi:hypothetical protein